MAPMDKFREYAAAVGLTAPRARASREHVLSEGAPCGHLDVVEIEVVEFGPEAMEVEKAWRFGPSPWVSGMTGILFLDWEVHARK